MRIFMRVGRLFTRALITVLLFLLSARGGETAELRKFSVGYSTVGPAGIGLWMAKEIGAFDKYGIDAELIFVSSGPVAVQALLGGDMKAGLAATNAVTSAVLAGAPLVSQHRGGSHRGGSSWRVKSLPFVEGQIFTFDIAPGAGAKRGLRLSFLGNCVCLRNSPRPSWQTFHSLRSRRRAASCRSGAPACA